MVDTTINFSDIYQDYYKKILRYLVKLIGNSDAEDVCQDVFVKVNKALEGFRKESKFSTWIYRIATNTALDYLRSRTRKPQLDGKSVDDEEGLIQLSENQSLSSQKKPATDQQLIRDEMSDCVKGHVEDLPQDYRVVLVLSEVDELKNQEIADILGITLDNVKIRLHRAKAKLKDKLVKSCDFYHNEENVLSCDKKQ